LNRWLAFFLIILVWSCDQGVNKKQKKISTYFDIEGLIDKQVKLLDSISPSLYKEAIINGQNETETFAPADSAAWAKELTIFKTADINKPTLVDRYNVRKSTDGKFVRYVSKTPESTEVDSISLQLDKAGVPIIIKAYLSKKNTLFKSAKDLELTFTDHLGKNLISSFSASGWQKMASKDSTVFSFNAKIIYP